MVAFAGSKSLFFFVSPAAKAKSDPVDYQNNAGLSVRLKRVHICLAGQTRATEF